MISPTSPNFCAQKNSRTWTAGVVVMGIAALMLSSVVLTPAARAAEPGEGSGELSGTEGGDKKPAYQLQAADPDNPQDAALVAAKKKAALDAELAKKSKPVDTEPVYQKWQFWAIVGGVAVALVGGIYATSKIVHSVRGGDVAPCPMNYAGCFGEGR